MFYYKKLVSVKESEQQQIERAQRPSKSKTNKISIPNPTNPRFKR